MARSMQTAALRRVTRAAGLVLAAVASGCGGSGGAPGSAPLPRATPGGPGSGAGTFASISIAFPGTAATGSGAARRPAYVSPSIASLAITIDGGPPAYLNAPARSGSPQTITTVLPVSPGSHAFLLAEYDGASGAGNLLGRVAQTNAIVAGTVNAITYTVDGQLAKILVQSVASPFVEGTIAGGVTLVGPAAQTFDAVPQDADGNTILTPGRVPALAVTSASPAIVASPVAGNQFTLAAPAPAASVRVTVTGSNLDNVAVTATFQASALAAFYVADFTVQKIRVFDERGMPLTLPATAFPALTNPMGLAYVPATTAAPGTVVVTQTSNFAAPFVQSFDLAGAAQPLGSSAFYGVESQPLFLTYAPVGAGELISPNYYTSSLSIFDTSGTPVTQAGGSFAGLAQPVGVAYDTDNQQIYVTNEATNALAAYTAAGAAKGTVPTASHPMGVVYDANDRSLYVASGGIGPAVLNASPAAPGAGDPQLASVAQFSEVPAAVRNPGGFANASTTAFFTGIALDPYSKQLYVSDAGDSKIDAFTEAGGAVALPAGAFSTINATSSPKADPMAILFVP